MKPASQISNTSRRDDSAGIARISAGCPKTDYQYQAGSFGDSSRGGNTPRRPSIRVISEEYFDHEARGHFASEAAFFALIFVTSAVPVIEGLRGLVHFVYGAL